MTRREHEVLSKTSDSEKARIQLLTSLLTPIIAGEYAGRLQDQLAQVAAQMAVSAATARRWYDAYRKEGVDGLINRARLMKDERLPAAFVDYFRTLCEQCQRNSKQAHRMLIAKWRNTDDAIPGYATPPPAGPHGHPRGWSYDNLMRQAPSRFELVTARQGRTAAAAYRQLVLTSRVGLEPGQYYQFDDLEHDLRVNFLGVNTRALRPLELACLDLASGHKVAYGLKPMIEDDEGAKRKLTMRDMRFLLCHLLLNIGYRAKGCVLCVEHGTAAISSDLESLISDASHGAVQIERSGIEGAAALHGWYEGRGKGNFRFKASLESHHNLAHNYTQALPAQMGLDRNRLPEELHGREKVNKLLVKASESLSAEKLALLKFPVLHFNQFAEILDHCYRAINTRVEHDLEGYVEQGWVTTEYRIDPSAKTWLPMHSLAVLPPEQQAAVSALIARPGHARTRLLSPFEVWQAGAKGLARLPAWAAPQLLGPDLAVQRHLADDGSFHFQDRELAPGRLTYLGRAVNNEGYEVLLRDREVYQTWVNPFDLRQMFVCTEKGAYIGVARRIESVRRDDTEAVHRAMGDAAHTEKVMLAPYRARHQADVEQRQADEANNALVLSGAPVTQAERQLEADLDAVRVTKADRAAAQSDQAAPAEPQFTAEQIAEFLKPE